MENVEHSKVEKTTSSSPNTKQNDCYDDEEHVINQNQQLPDKFNANGLLELMQSSCATRNALNNRSSQRKIDSEDVSPTEDIGTDLLENVRGFEPQAPVDLTSINTAKMNSAVEDYQMEPYNLKMDAIPNKNTVVDTLNMPTPNETLAATPVSNFLLDFTKSTHSNNSSAEAVQSPDVSGNQIEAVDKETVDSDKTNNALVQPSESILDLRINNANDGSQSPSFLAYQKRLSEIKIENTLESREDVFHPNEKQVSEITESAFKLNGNHGYSPEENCEKDFQNSSFVKKVTLPNENHEFIADIKQYPNDVNMLKSSLAENTHQHISSLTNSLHNLAEQGVKTLEEINNTESANDLNESHYSSTDSLNSASTHRSSSSRQLIIDQPAEDEKVPPLRLKLKRKHRKSTSSTECAEPSFKRANIEESSTANSSKDNLLEKLADFNTTFPLTNEAMTKCPYVDVVESNSVIPKVSAPADVIEDAAVPTPLSYMQAEPIQQELQAVVCENLLADSSIDKNLNIFKPPSTPQYYKCSTCGTFHENWSFFLHLQEKHDRFLCLYCIKCFPTAEKLALHLEIKHDLEQNHFNSEEAFRNSALVINGFSVETRFLMCCTCQYIFRENAAFTEHVCIEFMKSCMLCGQKGRHTNQCKANPMTKRRNKKKIRQKAKPPSLDALPQIESTLNVPPPPVLDELDAPMQQQQQLSQKTPVRRQTEDSNSSSNMVIDESCNTNHSLLPNQINPFKALDETERMEQEEAVCNKAHEAVNAESLVNSMFKFKLRVPKEFQKPVDEEISTSESEHAEVYEDEAADINSNQIEFKNNVLEDHKTSTSTPPPATCIAEQHPNTETSLFQSEEESVDDTVANAHLARILQEIEQTKLDIEKTKETLHQRHAQQPDNESIAPKDQMADESNAAAAADMHWTPTPPASPNLKTGDVYIKPADVPSSEPDLVTNPIITQPLPTSMDDSIEENLENLPLIEPVDNSLNATAIEPAPPDDGIEVANEDCLLVELQLDRPLDQFEIVEFVRICLKAAYPYCLYCNHARRIAVNAESLVLHLIAQHRFMATVDSITAEELQPSTLVAKLKSFLPALQDQFMNSSSYCTLGEGCFTHHFNERIFECFQCRFLTSTHKELYLHNRKMHLRTAILCFMCRCNFYSFSEILCHICPGIPHRVSIFEIKFRCCLCDLTDIPSPFRLMVHLRKRHFACDICLEDCRDQSKLSSHVWKHKLHHLCYRCGIAYRNKLDITKHLFWKHGTESALCKRCLQKRWPHVYHFCVPPAVFSCDVCQLCFSKAMYLTVHKRLHQNDFRYACTEANCQEKFISRKLLLKHSTVHEAPEIIKDEHDLSDQLEQKLEEHKEGELNETKSLVSVNETSVQSDLEAKFKSETEGIKDEVSDKETADSVKPEATLTQHQPKSPNETANTVEQAAALDQPNNEKKRKKRKKRAKESLEDLNLTAPNLSESGSSSESESETKSTTTTTRHELALSPLSEHGDPKVVEQATNELTAAGNNGGNVLDIWKNFLQAQQQTSELQQYAEYTEDNYPAPKYLHVCISDHDYCAMLPPKQTQANQQESTPPSAKHDSASGHTRTVSTSSEASSDDSSSSSSCSCGSNCSCSNGSSSSSSSGDSSDSSVSATKKRQRKKSERSNRHRKSFSSSPLKQPQAHNTSGDIVNILDTEDNANVVPQLQEEVPANTDEAKINLEPTINESDLETAESETDEEYYDEHPQKLATELLSQKRAQLMARTLLSPSHNFDIVENSRPSTPSLPEDVIYEKRQKKKKNKRDRKSTSNSKMLAATPVTSAPANELQQYLTTTTTTQRSTMDPLLAPTPMEPYNHNQGNSYMPPHTLEAVQLRLPPTTANHYIPRISEGSSCSDADYSLKRSKRQRRPNKFYGYTSDDESMAPATLGQTLVIGMRAYKPLPPPQLVWDKEDLPTPDKSILNANKKTTRQLSTLNTSNAGSDEHSTKKKKTATHRKRSSGQHSMERQKLPPIPRLTIRSALFNKSTDASGLGLEDSSDSASSEIEQHTMPPLRKRAFPPKKSATGSSAAATFLPRYLPNQQPQQATVATVTAQFPAPPLLPPTPQTTAFNHKIPPALLPNPDFSTLQYFKANNIRYPIRPPAGARAAREGESVYCYCRCPYDEVSEMIACDGDSCLIEWFHFECVGIMLAPQGKWFCAECRPQYSEELYPTTTAASTVAN